MALQTPIYLDNHATTPVDPRVLAAMLPYFTERFGNAASKSHAFGWEADAAVDTAREQVAKLIGAASPREIVFTSGATESDNLAIKGVADAYRDKGNHIVTCVTEHKAVLDSCKVLAKHGFEITYLPVGSDGLIDLQRLRAAHHGQDDFALDHGGEQRDRHDPAGQRDRPLGQRKKYLVSYRRDPRRRQVSDRRRRPWASICCR